MMAEWISAIASVISAGFAVAAFVQAREAKQTAIRIENRPIYSGGGGGAGGGALGGGQGGHGGAGGGVRAG
jgi:hypothetical protein